MPNQIGDLEIIETNWYLFGKTLENFDMVHRSKATSDGKKGSYPLQLVIAYHLHLVMRMIIIAITIRGLNSNHSYLRYRYYLDSYASRARSRCYP